MENLKKNRVILLILFIFLAFGYKSSLAQMVQKFLPISYNLQCIDAAYDLGHGSKDYVLFGNVLLLQTFLFQNNIMSHAPTGYFGPITEEALKKYQLLRNLQPTGYFDANTRKAVARDTCKLDEIINNAGNISYYPSGNGQQFPDTTPPGVAGYFNITEEMIFPR